MKRFEFPLDQYQLEILLGSFRSKRDVIEFWMQAYKVMVNYSPPEATNISGVMTLCVDKMQRLFVKYDEKVFSSSFPISLKERDDKLVGHLRSGTELTPKDSSEVLAVICNTTAFGNSEILGFCEDIEQNTNEPDRLWMILSELMQAEDGYLRVDHDEARQNGHLHPLNHIDVCYTQSATFKVGLSDRMEIEVLEDLLNRNSDCHYLSTPDA